jgi:signal transduction histidine kinase
MMGDPVNLSREFRALVTSIRGPLEDELAERAALPPARRERLRTLHRDVMRLFQLANTLFDLSGLEVSQRAGSELVDLAAKTVVIPRLRDAAPEVACEPARLGHGDDAEAWAADLARANQELEAFSYSVSHDLRGPLRAVDGFSQVLLANYAHALDRDGRDLVEQIHSNTQRMRAIIDDLLTLSHVGRGELCREPVDLTAIARRIVADLRLREPSRSVDVSLTAGLAARCDGRLVAIALENLFANAWKFTSKRCDAQIAFDREDSGVFAVRDNGAGFDMTYSDHLFEPFQRLHSNSDFEGTGIGLAIVRRVIERHGGDVWAEGLVDGGATMRFTLEPAVS